MKWHCPPHPHSQTLGGQGQVSGPQQVLGRWAEVPVGQSQSGCHTPWFSGGRMAKNNGWTLRLPAGTGPWAGELSPSSSLRSFGYSEQSVICRSRFPGLTCHRLPDVPRKCALCGPAGLLGVAISSWHFSDSTGGAGPGWAWGTAADEGKGQRAIVCPQLRVLSYKSTTEEPGGGGPGRDRVWPKSSPESSGTRLGKRREICL